MRFADACSRFRLVDNQALLLRETPFGLVGWPTVTAMREKLPAGIRPLLAVAAVLILLAAGFLLLAHRSSSAPTGSTPAAVGALHFSYPSSYSSVRPSANGVVVANFALSKSNTALGGGAFPENKVVFQVFEQQPGSHAPPIPAVPLPVSQPVLNALSQLSGKTLELHFSAHGQSYWMVVWAGSDAHSSDRQQLVEMAKSLQDS